MPVQLCSPAHWQTDFPFSYHFTSAPHLAKVLLWKPAARKGYISRLKPSLSNLFVMLFCLFLQGMDPVLKIKWSTREWVLGYFMQVNHAALQLHRIWESFFSFSVIGSQGRALYIKLPWCHSPLSRTMIGFCWFNIQRRCTGRPWLTNWSET